jgi:imidazolonepropionase-like amidohydrolase
MARASPPVTGGATTRRSWCGTAGSSRPSRWRSSPRGPRRPSSRPRRTLDLDGRALLPGLIDLHTHLLLHPYDESVVGRAGPEGAARAADDPRGRCRRSATLEAGFTTIRELGTEGAGFADAALRDAIRLGIAVGPRIFATTRAIVATGCYGPLGFEPRAAIPKGAQEADGADAIRKAVREQIAAGADWIKLYADYRRRAGEAATPTFSLDELKAAVDEASTAGRKVAVHATTDEGIRRALLAGAATIEHGDGASDATLALMKERGTVLCPTLAAVEALALSRDGSRARAAAAARARQGRRPSRARAGVTIACGSDAGVFAHGTNAREIELLVACGAHDRRGAARGDLHRGARARPRATSGASSRARPPTSSRSTAIRSRTSARCAASRS